MKVITVKNATIKASDGKEWIELIDTEDKTHRIFSSIQRVDGSWASLKKDIEVLKEKIGNHNFEGMKLGLTKEPKEKDGKKYWNVVAVDFNPPDEPNPDKPKAEYRGRDEGKVDMRTFIMEIGEDWRAGKRDKNDPLWKAREIWLMGVGQVTETTKPEPPKEISIADIKKIRDDNKWTLADCDSFCNKNKKWKVRNLKELNQEQRKELIEFIGAHPK
jgi:hypothetical protein